MFVDEIFYGLQGEGNRMGFPSVFIRIGGCNLCCKGFGCKTISPKTGEILYGCDTIHAANTEHFIRTWTDYKKSFDIINIVLNQVPKNRPYNEERVDIIFTGGEPFLFHKNKIMIEVVEYFISRGHKVYFETNGTINIDFNEFDIYKKVSMSISVKMSNSGEEKRKRWRPEVVNNYLKHTKDSYFKFVMSKDNLENESDEIFEFLSLVPTYGTVYCMPKGETQKELKENSKAIYEFVSKQGFRYSDRLHIRIFSDKRGV